MRGRVAYDCQSSPLPRTIKLNSLANCPQQFDRLDSNDIPLARATEGIDDPEWITVHHRVRHGGDIYLFSEMHADSSLVHIYS